MEIGRYIDFHNTDADTSDYTFRLDNSSNGVLQTSGSLTVNSNISLTGELNFTPAGEKYVEFYTNTNDNVYLRLLVNDSDYHNAVTLTRGGAVTLFHNNSAKLATSSTGVNVTGTLSATTLSGTLANTLTLNTSGTGLSGSTTYNNSGAATFTVTSNATSSNTASTIVARDGSGNFSAGTITANLNGNATTATTASNVSITSTNANITNYLHFGDLTTGSDNVNIDTNLTYNPSTNTLTVTSGTVATTTGSFAGTVSAVDFNSTSDINLKKNINPIENSLDKILELNGVSFEWKSNDEKSLGVIAQEVEKIFPELVKETEDKKSVNYNGLVGVLIEAVKELSARVEELESKS